MVVGLGSRPLESAGWLWAALLGWGLQLSRGHAWPSCHSSPLPVWSLKAWVLALGSCLRASALGCQPPQDRRPRSRAPIPTPGWPEGGRHLVYTWKLLHDESGYSLLVFSVGMFSVFVENAAASWRPPSWLLSKTTFLLPQTRTPGRICGPFLWRILGLEEPWCAPHYNTFQFLDDFSDPLSLPSYCYHFWGKTFQNYSSSWLCYIEFVI